MNLIKTIPGGAKIVAAFVKSKKYMGPIDEAVAAGDRTLERERIKIATDSVSDEISQILDIKYDIIHPENIPSEGPVVYIANHQSYLDIISFLAVVKTHQLSFIAKESLTKVPIIGTWVTKTRGIFIRRGDARASLQTINEGAEYLKNGYSLVIFPEGTRSQGGPMKEFKAGSFKLATKAKAKLVPVTIEGTYNVFEKPGYPQKHQTVHMVFHEAIDTAAIPRTELAGLPAKVQEIVRQGFLEIPYSE